MRSTASLVLSLFVVLAAPAALAHDVTISGTTSFAALDGSSLDHDGVANGVFTVSDGNLIVNGVVNCNDDGGGDNACAMAFAVSGNMTINSGGALYAENRSGGGSGGAITLTVGGDLVLNGGAIVSSASKSSSGATGGAITANAGGGVTIASSATIDAGSANARGGNVTIVGAGAVSVDGNVLSGPSRTILSTRLTDIVLDGGTGNQIGGQIAIRSTSFAEPAVVVGANANVVSQGNDGGAGPVTIEGCGIEVRGLAAALSRKDSAAKVAIRSGRSLLVDGRDLGGSGTRMGRVRADAPTGTAVNKGVDLFAAGSVSILGPSGSLFVITSHPGVHDSKSYGGTIRVISTGDAVTATGNVADSGQSAAGDSGGTIDVAAKLDANLAGAVIRAIGDSSTGNPNRGGGSISVRSYSGNVVWTNGTGDVRPVGSLSGLVPGDQGSIVLTACGTVNTTGTSFPVMGTATSPLPDVHTGVCSPSAPSLPAGTPPFVLCNTPPVANPASVSTNEDHAVTIHLSGSDADGDTLTFSIVTNPVHGSLGAIVPTGPNTADVTYTPVPDYFGSDSFVFRVDDGHGGTNDATVSITVVSVNDRPSFQIGPTQTVLEDAGMQTVSNWATSISPGPANESSQTVTFTVTNDNPSLFSMQPAVSSSGTLTYTPAPNANGIANLSVVAHDDGGTANGGQDTSAPQPSSITVTAVNDAPSFTPGGDVTLDEDSGAYSATWATAISAGPNEGGQTVHFNYANDNHALFSQQPSISPSGVLMFTSAPNVSGSATVTVTLQDDGGTANGGVDTSAIVTFTITINPVNDPPTAVNDTFDTFGNTELRVDLSAASTPSVVRTTPSGKGVLHNDSDVEGDPLVVSGIVGCGDATAPFDCTLASGKLSMNANGTFSFVPAPGATSASFQYVVTDQPSVGTPASSIGTVTINIAHMIWYVNGSAPAGGNGTSASPFNDFASLNGAGGSGDADGSGDIIFVHDSTVNGAGLELEDGQHFLGEGVGLTVDSYSLVAAGNKPKFFSTTSAAAFIQVAATAEVAGLELHGNDGVLVVNSGASPGGIINANIHDNAIVATFKGIDVVTPGGVSTNVDVNNTSIAAVNAGFSVATTSPASVSFTNGSIVSSGNSGIVWSGGGSANLTVTALANVTIDGNTFGDGIDITGATFDASAAAGVQTVNGGTIAVGVSGNPVGGAGIAMSNVSGDYGVASMNVFGTSGVSVGGSGLFTGAAGMRITNGGGTIVAGTGTALAVTNATIGAANVNFTSITSSGGRATGIILDTTGTAGGLVVSGTGSAGSGGTIANKTGADGATTTGNGIYLNNTNNVSLASMNLHDFDNFAIRGLRVGGFSMSGCVINGANGNSATFDTYGEGSVYFGSTSVNGLTGSASVSNCTISGGRGRNFSVVNSSGTLNRLTISNTTFGATNGAIDSGHSLAVEARNSGTVVNVTVTGSTLTSAAGDIANFTGQSGTTMDVVFQSNHTSDNHPNNIIGGGGLTFATAGAMTVNASSNTLRDANGSALTLFKATAGTSLSAVVANNQIGVAGVANSGSASGNGIFLSAGGSGTIGLNINNNVIRNYANAAIYADNTGGNYSVNASITNNTAAEPGPGAFAGLALTAGAPSSADAITVCANITGNDFSTADPNDFADIILGVSTAASTMRLPGYAGSTLSDVQTFVFNNNNVPGTAVFAYTDPPATDSNFTGGAACPTP